MVYPAIIEAGSAGGTASLFGSAGYACILCVINYSYLISMPVVMWINKLAKKN